MNFANVHSSIKTLLAATAFLIFQCCSPITVNRPSPGLEGIKIASLVSDFEEQAWAARTLFYSGTLTFNHPDAETAVQILMIADAGHRAGTRAGHGVEPGGRADTQVCPYGRIKIEITHPWGKPLLHILIRGRKLDILDFTEKRIYRDSLDSRQISDNFPMPLDPCVLWSLARAFPVLVEHRQARSLAGNQITLLDSNGDKIQVVELYSGELLPHKVCFIKEHETLVFSNFENDDGILYARQVKFHGPAYQASLEIAIDQMTFNKPLPEAVFEMEAPHDFTIVHLENPFPEH